MLNHGRKTTLAAMNAALVAGAALVWSATPAEASAAHYKDLVPASPAASVKLLDTITVTGKCPIQDSNARIIAEYPVEWPEVALQMNAAPGTSTVLIDLDNRGHLVNARIATSSGNALFDQEALLGARMSKYAPEVRACTTAARSYYLDVKFELAD
jgi:TonB family protein